MKKLTLLTSALIASTMAFAQTTPPRKKFSIEQDGYGKFCIK